MAWFTTDEGKHVNTDWFDEDERRKYRQLEQNQAEASGLNSRDTRRTTYNKQGFEVEDTNSPDIEFSENTWKKMAELRKLGGFEDPELKDLVDNKIYDLVSEYGDLERYDSDLTTLRERLDESGITSDEYWTGYHVMADQLKIKAPRYTVLDESESAWDNTFGSAEEAREWASQRDDAKYVYDKWTRKKEKIGGSTELSEDVKSDLERRKMSLNTIKYEEKKWAKRQSKFASRNPELENLESGVDFINEHFGDTSDLIGQVYIRSGPWSGLYDREGYQGRGRATYFNGGGYIGEGLVVHEFTHAVSDEIASHYRELGFSSEQEVFSAIRSEVYRNLNKQEPTYDGRKWAHRPEEYISRGVEAYGDRRETKRNALYRGDTDFVDSPVSAESAETLSVLKKWWKKVRANDSAAAEKRVSKSAARNSGSSTQRGSGRSADLRIATTLSKRGISADWEIEQYFRNLSPQRRSQLAAQMGVTSTGDERIREMAMRVFAAGKEF